MRTCVGIVALCVVGALFGCSDEPNQRRLVEPLDDVASAYTHVDTGILEHDPSTYQPTDYAPLDVEFTAPEPEPAAAPVLDTGDESPEQRAAKLVFQEALRGFLDSDSGYILSAFPPDSVRPLLDRTDEIDDLLMQYHDIQRMIPDKAPDTQTAEQVEKMYTATRQLVEAIPALINVEIISEDTATMTFDTQAITQQLQQVLQSMPMQASERAAAAVGLTAMITQLQDTSVDLLKTEGLWRLKLDMQLPPSVGPVVDELVADLQGVLEDMEDRLADAENLTDEDIIAIQQEFQPRLSKEVTEFVQQMTVALQDAGASAAPEGD